MAKSKEKTPGLTAKAVEHAKPRDGKDRDGKPCKLRTEIPDGDMPGLFLVVQPTGAKSWALRYVYNKRNYKLTLGSAEVLSLADARKQSLKAKSEKATGANPIQTRKEARDRDEAARLAELERKAEATAREKIDAEDAFELRYETYRVEHIEKEMKGTTAADVKKIFERDVLPEFRKLRLAEIRKKHVEKLLVRILKEKGPYSALRLYALLNHFFGFFEKKTYEDEAENDVAILALSPMRNVEPPAKAQKRRRVLTDDEIRWFWLACEADRERKFEVGKRNDRKILKSTYGAILQLLLLTATRRNQVGHMTRSEINVSTGDWIIPSAHIKGGELDFLIPLAPESNKILNEVPHIAGKPGFVFTTTGKTPLSGLSKCKKRIAKAMLKMAREQAKARGENPADVTIPAWRVHDLRRTARTNFSRLGIRGEIAERCVNHTIKHSDVEEVYNLYDYKPEKAEAFAKWADFVQRLVAEKPANVIDIVARKGAA